MRRCTAVPFICSLAFLLTMVICGGAFGRDQPASVTVRPLPHGGPAAPAAPMADIHDIKAMEKLVFNPAWLWYGLILILGGLLILLGIKTWRKKKVWEVEQEIFVPRPPPEETAYALLEEIQPLMDSDGKKFYFRLSSVIRGYIQERYDIPALEMTTEELAPAIGKFPLKRTLADGLRSFLQASDPVKFAGAPAGKHGMQTHYEFVYDFVKQTTPVPESLEPEGPDGAGGR